MTAITFRVCLLISTQKQETEADRCVQRVNLKLLACVTSYDLPLGGQVPIISHQHSNLTIRHWSEHNIYLNALNNDRNRRNDKYLT